MTILNLVDVRHIGHLANLSLLGHLRSHTRVPSFDTTVSKIDSLLSEMSMALGALSGLVYNTALTQPGSRMSATSRHGQALSGDQVYIKRSLRSLPSNYRVSHRDDKEENLADGKFRRLKWHSTTNRPIALVSSRAVVTGPPPSPYKMV